MEQICEFSITNKLGQKECMADENHRPCAFQKYCGKEYTWKFTENFLNCKRRELEMAKKENTQENINTSADIEKNIVEDKITIDASELESHKNFEHGKVICICDGFVIAEREDGTGFIVYDIDAKIGDAI